ncbi:MAG: 13E12 repeat family protein, partial [Corynebacterium variabile]|nr:13E12 repeat family protein [Corynebacterium variabile]
QGPDSLDSLRNFLLDLAGAEETYTDKDHQRLRSFSVGRQGIDGMTPVRGLLTPEAAATLTRLMIDHATTGSLCDGRDEANEDTRTPDQRRHDVLLAGYGPDKPLATGRGATTIVAVMGIDQLSSGRGTALTDVGAMCRSPPLSRTRRASPAACRSRDSRGAPCSSAGPVGSAASTSNSHLSVRRR